MDSVAADFYRLFFRKSEIGIWLGILRRPVPPGLSKRRQYLHLSRQGYLARCNRSFAAPYGVTDPRSLTGAALGQLFCHTSSPDDDLLAQFVRSSPGGEVLLHSRETGRGDLDLWFENSCMGVYKANRLIRIWGRRRILSEQEQNDLARRKHLASLTANQVLILKMTVHGKTLKEIGVILSLSMNTVESYRMRALRKLGIRNVAELIRDSITLGLGTDTKENRGSNLLSW